MLKKLLVALIASAFAMGAYAQAQKAEPKGQSGTTTQPATPPSTSAKGDTKVEGKSTKAKKAKTAKASKTKAKSDDAKDSRKDATKKSDTSATTTEKKASPK
jgi:hypothetical protein